MIELHNTIALARHLYYFFLRVPQFKTDNMILLLKWYNIYQDFVYNFKDILVALWV